MIASDCLSDDAVLDWVEGRLPETERQAAEAHLAVCSACTDVVAAAAGGTGPLAPGSELGRYTIESTLGAGGMGIVYAALDRELGRKVALKLVRSEADPALFGALLQREAKTLARLSHPNVVAVYDAGLRDGQLLIAMELVEGVTLRQWLAEKPRRFDEVGVVIRQAAAGLAAAHAVGIVHRDMKPENILVGRDGRVRVSDFGLSRLEESLDELPSKVVGTPAYMAPEQSAGEPVDARADVYAFCVVAWEAWFGARPERDLTPVRFAFGRDRGVQRVLARGLVARRQDRPSLDEIVAALDVAERRPRRVALAASLLVVAASTGFAVQHVRGLGCDAELAAWDTVWNDTTRAAFARALATARLAGADDIGKRVDALFARYVATGRGAHREVCEAHRHATSSTAVYDQQALCLRARRHEAATLASALTGDDANVLSEAVATASRLPHLDACTTSASLVALAPLPSDSARRKTIDALNATVAEAQAASTLGRYPRCVELAKPAAEAARTVGYAPLEARALLAWSRCREFTENVPLSEATLHEAASAAQRGGDLRTLASAWARLVFTTGWEHHDFDGSDRWATYARATLDRLGPDDELEFKLTLNLALAHSRANRPDADELFAKSSAIAIRWAGPDSIEAMSAAAAEAGHWVDRNDPSRALTVYRAMLEKERARFGPLYPGTLTTLSNLVITLRLLERNEEALATADELVALSQKFPDYPDAGSAQQVYAAALRGNHRYAAALDADRRAAADCLRARGENWECAFALAGSGLDLLGLGRPHEAIEPLEHAWKLREKDDIPDPEIALGLARALWSGGGDKARADSLGRRALADQKRTIALAATEANRKILDSIESWLEHHGS